VPILPILHQSKKMEIKNIVAELDDTTKALLEAVSSFTEEQFNTVPFADSWTAAQVAEHLLKSESGVQKTLTAATRPAERNPEEKAGILRSIFLDLTTRLKAPEFIIPSDKPQEKESLFTALRNTRARIRESVSTLDLSEACTSFPLPALGELTRYEWACFVIYHSQRHIHQLRNIHEKLSAGKR
jgi:hypothetical protein